jgi:methylmalonyl-CoA mutase N-terminal domain/subunit
VESAYRFQKEVEAKKRVIVGVNEFVAEEEIPIKTLQIDPEIERKLIARLKRMKRQRNRVRVEETLNNLRKAAGQEDVNLMPFMLHVVKEYATLGEICDVLREVFGEYKPPSIF